MLLSCFGRACCVVVVCPACVVVFALGCALYCVSVLLCVACVASAVNWCRSVCGVCFLFVIVSVALVVCCGSGLHCFSVVALFACCVRVAALIVDPLCLCVLLFCLFAGLSE